MGDVKILLVEEDAQEALNLRKTLESNGYIVPNVATNGKDAISKAHELVPDLILIDLILKGEFRGIQNEMATEIKKLDIPILYLFVHSEDVKIQKDFITEPHSYLIKPYGDAELKHAIELVLYKNKIKKEFKESENYYKAIFKHTGTATVIIEEDATISLVNNEFEKLSGFSREEIEGKKSWIEFTSKEDIEKMMEYHRRRRLNSTSAPLLYDFRFIDRQGNVKNIHLDIGMVPDTKKSVASLLDVTELKRSQEAVKRSETKYRGLFDNAADGIFLMKGDSFVECNEKALEIYGVTREQIIGQSPYVFSPELQPDGKKSKDGAIDLINNALNGYPQQFEWQHIRYDGTLFYAEVTLNRLKIEDEYLIQAIVRDVTERKKAEELEKENIKLQELDKLKSMFIASMSHELRTPLNSIIGFTGIILQGMTGELTEEQRRQLNIVKNSANHLLSLINDVIDLSKIEADKVELFIEDFDLSPVLTDIRESFMEVVGRKGLKMSVEMPESLMVYGDERRTKQVIMNMVSNAVKFTDNGDVTIDVSEDDGMIEVTVEDTGIGIREEDQRKLFQAFSRIHVEDQPIVEGTGLGLYLSQKIAGLLGGRIQAKSQFNKGSEFTFIFPAKYSKSEVIP
jgi:PAS domain S-box-containing protein